jgi:hypothetical protein
MASPTQLPTWVEKTLQDAGELVDDPVDTRMTRSQFFGAPQALAATETLLPIHFYMSLGSDPNSHSEVADILTKSFTEKKFLELRAMLGVVETTGSVTFGHSTFFFLFFFGGGGGGGFPRDFPSFLFS